MATLYSLLLAFGVPLAFSGLVAGYAVGILFGIVAITPQGIGAVEGAMMLVFRSLGVPAGVATVTTLSFRGVAFWLPMAIGFFLVRRLRSFDA
jgi:uncharacterized protein (TIRG00374 family)